MIYIWLFHNLWFENFADDNTVSNVALNTNELFSNLEDDSRRAIDRFKNNHMIANTDKFKVIIIDKKDTDYSILTLNINNETLNASREVTLLGITIGDQLSFTKQVTIMCRTAANKLSAIKILNKYLSKVTKITFVSYYGTW